MGKSTSPPAGRCASSAGPQWRSFENDCSAGPRPAATPARRAGAPARLNPTLQAFSKERHCGPAELAYRPAGGLVEFPMTAVDASATEARRLLANPAPDADRRLRRLLPPAVLDYIRAHRLYS